MANAIKTKKCGRCNGTGFRNTPVGHLGVPGLCFKCDGRCEVAVLTMEQRVERYAAGKQSHLDELVKQAETIKIVIARGDVFDVNDYEDKLDRLRETYRRVNGELKAVREAGKVTAKQCPREVSLNTI